jgi:hypothetical protein
VPPRDPVDERCQLPTGACDRDEMRRCIRA